MTVDVTSWVETGGPWVLFAMTAAETAFITGLVVPASVATAFGAFLAAEGYLALPMVAGFAAAGALLGDQLGFWLGRRFGPGVLRGEGRLRSLARRHEPRAAALFRGHPIYAVSFARLVSFVRTLMPMAAGMSRISWGRYVFYDLLGVAGWLVGYCAAGYLAGRSWRWVAGALGTGWAVLFVVGAGVWWLIARHRRLREGGPTALERRVVPETDDAGGSVGLGES
ncbi:MAG: DedA family protein [Longimicrobiales bacterium]|nr:DedA family protein [Longimicrobiales bacterium]